eukprot:scaffold27560_cov142-Isochrysis_galbana.AAC.6
MTLSYFKPWTDRDGLRVMVMVVPTSNQQTSAAPVADGSGRTPTVGVPRVLSVVCACVPSSDAWPSGEWRQSRTLRTPERGWPIVDPEIVVQGEGAERDRVAGHLEAGDVLAQRPRGDQHQRGIARRAEHLRSGEEGGVRARPASGGAGGGPAGGAWRADFVLLRRVPVLCPI